MLGRMDEWGRSSGHTCRCIREQQRVLMWCLRQSSSETGFAHADLKGRLGCSERIIGPDLGPRRRQLLVIQCHHWRVGPSYIGTEIVCGDSQGKPGYC